MLNAMDPLKRTHSEVLGSTEDSNDILSLHESEKKPSREIPLEFREDLEQYAATCDLLAKLPQELADLIYQKLQLAEKQALQEVNRILGKPHATKTQTIEAMFAGSSLDLFEHFVLAGVFIGSTRSSGGLSWLYKAVKANHSGMIRELLDAGAQLNAPLWDGWPLLEAAVEAKNLFLQRYILRQCSMVRYISGKEGADESEPWYELQSELVHAHKAGVYPKFVRRGPEANGISRNAENSILYHAVMEKYAPLVQTLLEFGADPEERTLAGRSLIDIANAKEDKATVRVLRQAIATPYPKRIEAIKRENQLELFSRTRAQKERRRVADDSK